MKNNDKVGDKMQFSHSLLQNEEVTMLLTKEENGGIRCMICPNACLFTQDKQRGMCSVRVLKNGKIINQAHGIITGQSFDPIEKKPLFHFNPGSSVFSIGFLGCSFHCEFCQNHRISQVNPPFKGQPISSNDLMYFVREKNINQIAFTYSEPTIHYEWLLNTVKACRESGIKTILVTNGYLTRNAADELLNYIDAINIDLKSWSAHFYKQYCKGKIEPVKEFIKLAYKKHIHIEITTLVIDKANDSLEECNEICDFIAGISKDIPFHISKYFKTYKMNNDTTPDETVYKWLEIAKTKLNYVYGGNISTENNTLCKDCKSLLIERQNYTTTMHGISPNGECRRCGGYNNIKIF